jgi:hypothetical protein
MFPVWSSFSPLCWVMQAGLVFIIPTASWLSQTQPGVVGLDQLLLGLVSLGDLRLDVILGFGRQTVKRGSMQCGFDNDLTIELSAI